MVSRSAVILSLWVQVKIDVKINEWFGVFYDMILCKHLQNPKCNYTTRILCKFAVFLLQVCILLCMLQLVFLQHTFLFRWRTAMVEWYQTKSHDKARKIEGSFQKGPKKIQLNLQELWKA